MGVYKGTSTNVWSKIKTIPIYNINVFSSSSDLYVSVGVEEKAGKMLKIAFLFLTVLVIVWAAEESSLQNKPAQPATAEADQETSASAYYGGWGGYPRYGRRWGGYGGGYGGYGGYGGGWGGYGGYGGYGEYGGGWGWRRPYGYYW